MLESLLAALGRAALSAMPLAKQGNTLVCTRRKETAAPQELGVNKGAEVSKDIPIQAIWPQSSNTFSGPNLEGDEEFHLQHRQAQPTPPW